MIPMHRPATPPRDRAFRGGRRRPILWAALAVVIVGCSRPDLHHPAIGKGVGPLPITALADAERPAPSLVGRVTLLNFWGTWCPPCRRELPGLARLAARLEGDPRFQLVAVSCGPGGPDDRDEIAADTGRFLERSGVSLDAWCDPSGMTRTIFASAYGFDAFPTTYLVGHDGRILRVWTGYAGKDEAEMAAAIVEALKGCPEPSGTEPAAR